MKQAIKLQEILRDLEEIPADKLEQISQFVKSVLSQSPKKRKQQEEPKTLSGIWENKGFEKIVDLEGEIHQIRKEIGDQILRRRL